MSGQDHTEQIAILDPIPLPQTIFALAADTRRAATASAPSLHLETATQAAAAARAIEDQMFNLLGISRDDVAKYGSDR